MDMTRLLIRSKAAIARFERAYADGNPAELAEARTALAICHEEVRLFVAVQKAMKSEKLETVQESAPVASGSPGNGLRLAHWADRRPRDLSPRP